MKPRPQRVQSGPWSRPKVHFQEREIVYEPRAEGAPCRQTHAIPTHEACDIPKILGVMGSGSRTVTQAEGQG